MPAFYHDGVRTELADVAGLDPLREILRRRLEPPAQASA
jgi:hypothetical protein